MIRDQLWNWIKNVLTCISIVGWLLLKSRIFSLCFQFEPPWTGSVLALLHQRLRTRLRASIRLFPFFNIPLGSKGKMNDFVQLHLPRVPLIQLKHLTGGCQHRSRKAACQHDRPEQSHYFRRLSLFQTTVVSSGSRSVVQAGETEPATPSPCTQLTTAERFGNFIFIPPLVRNHFKAVTGKYVHLV